MTNSSDTNLNSRRLPAVGDKDVPHQSPGLTLVSDWGERGQIGKADVNATYGGPLGEARRAGPCQHTGNVKYNG